MRETFMFGCLCTVCAVVDFSSVEDAITGCWEARTHCPRHTILVVQVAPGIDIEKDIFAHMEFKPIVSPSLKTMDPSLFQVTAMDGVRSMLMTV